MFKGKDIIGKPLISFKEGRIIESVKDVIFDSTDQKVLAFLLEEAGLFSEAQIVPFDRVKSIGVDAVTVNDTGAIVEANQSTITKDIIARNNAIRNKTVMTEEGMNLGKVTDLYFDETSGKVLGYEVSGGIFKNAFSGKSYLPAPTVFRFGDDVAFVPTETAKMMQEQRGGIKGMFMQGKDRVDQMEKDVKDKIDKDDLGGKMNEFLDKSKSAFKEQAENVKDHINEARTSTQNFEQNLKEKVLGSRLNKTLRSVDGSIIAAEGQIVTEDIVNKAKEASREAELLAAVAYAQSKDYLQKGRTDMKDAYSTLSSRADTFFNDLKDKVFQAKEKVQEQRIRFALGRPVNRVILDDSDNVILNTGELITHEAVEKAKAAKVLDLLLTSVSKDKPIFNNEDLRANV